MPLAPPGAAPGCTWGLGQSRWYLVLGTWARRGSSRARRGSGGIRRGWGGGRAGLDDVDVFWRHCWLNWHLGILVRLKFQPCGCLPAIIYLSTPFLVTLVAWVLHCWWVSPGENQQPHLVACFRFGMDAGPTSSLTSEE